jgi:hypothetical protein
MVRRATGVCQGHYSSLPMRGTNYQVKGVNELRGLGVAFEQRPNAGQNVTFSFERMLDKGHGAHHIW